jgi:hypothetical protein
LRSPKGNMPHCGYCGYAPTPNPRPRPGRVPAAYPLHSCTSIRRCAATRTKRAKSQKKPPLAGLSVSVTKREWSLETHPHRSGQVLPWKAVRVQGDLRKKPADEHEADVHAGLDAGLNRAHGARARGALHYERGFVGMLASNQLDSTGCLRRTGNRSQGQGGPDCLNCRLYCAPSCLVFCTV